MSLSFQIVPQRDLVYVSYVGTTLIKQAAQTFGAYVAHKDFVPGQKQLIDLSRVTGYERDHPRMYDMQMRKADVFVKRDRQTLMVYYAPHEKALALATLIVRSWEGVPGTDPRIVTTSEADALHLIGVPERSFAELLGCDAAGQEHARG